MKDDQLEQSLTEGFITLRSLFPSCHCVYDFKLDSEIVDLSLESPSASVFSYFLHLILPVNLTPLVDSHLCQLFPREKTSQDEKEGEMWSIELQISLNTFSFFSMIRVKDRQLLVDSDYPLASFSLPSLIDPIFQVFSGHLPQNLSSLLDFLRSSHPSICLPTFAFISLGCACNLQQQMPAPIQQIIESRCNSEKPTHVILVDPELTPFRDSVLFKYFSQSQVSLFLVSSAIQRSDIPSLAGYVATISNSATHDGKVVIGDFIKSFVDVDVLDQLQTYPTHGSVFRQRDRISFILDEHFPTCHPLQQQLALPHLPVQSSQGPLSLCSFQLEYNSAILIESSQPTSIRKSPCVSEITEWLSAVGPQSFTKKKRTKGQLNLVGSWADRTMY